MWVKKEPVLKVVKPEDPEWKLLHRVADSKLDQVKKAFLLAIAATQEKIVVTKMAEALAAGDLAAVESMIDWGAFGASFGIIQDVFRDIAEEVGKAAARELGRRIRAELRFDLLNPRAVEFIRQHTGDLIRQITEESRQAIRAIIRQAFEEGGHPHGQVKKIVQHIGLTERQSRAVENYRRRQLEAGASKAEADRRAEAYAKRLLWDRAENIARTETLLAANEGQREVWRQAADQGLIDGAEFEREWITTPDDRLCPLCLAMDGKRAPIGGVYDNGSGGPPLHPRCRCAEGLVRRRT
ncbi:MAG: phage minor head protein [Moorellales bacterium]